jgi:hypothetical protein
MKKFLLFAGIALVIIIILYWITTSFNTSQTKSASPEQTVSFIQDNLTIEVFYNRPFKKGRVIFGGLVPYNVVWRTGANEATTFETSKTLSIEGKRLNPGKYSLWTIPGPDKWVIIFNSQFGQWGINAEGNANRDPALDVLKVEIVPIAQEKEFEQFTIAFDQVGEEAEMVLMWDKTLVALPFSY